MRNKQKICAIIDLAGSRYNGEFLVREIGYIGLGRYFKTAKGEIYDFKPFMLGFAEPPARKRGRRSAAPPPPPIDVLDLNDLDSNVIEFYETVKTKANNVIAFKGGDCEKELLERLGIPYKNLEDLGCPRYDDMDTRRYKHLACKYHKKKDLHCPMSEVTAFKDWFVENCQ